MTLSTYIRLTTWPSIGAEGVLDWVNTNLLHAPRPPQRSQHGRHVSNSPGQGFDAWVMLYHNHGALIEDDPDDYAPGSVPPAGYLSINFDTAYSFRGDHGETPAMLHAGYIVDLVARFGADLWWQNEFDGSWHRGPSGLERLIGAGDEADAWFRNVMLPAFPDVNFGA